MKTTYLKTLFVFCLALCFSLLVPHRANAAFGLADSGGYYTVDTGAGLVFKVKQTNGDITSLKYNGTEYQDQARFSQVNSGLGSATVTGVLWGSQTIKIEVTAGTLTHYYLARKNQNNIYMGTYFTEEPSIGLVRYIVRIPSAKLPNGPTTSDIRNNVGAVEASDVFRLANGETRSKHYSDHRLIDFAYTGATGNGVGVFMVRSNHEGGSGGPFYRTIDNQCGDDQEIYEIVNYGEGQTEPLRTGVFNGPYILTFTGGTAPTTPLDTSWIHSTGIDATLKGWVQNRGTVTGTATGVPSGFQTVVGFSNSTAQYWCVAKEGTFTSPAMIPGTYTMTLYKGELAVATQSVTVPASDTPVTQNIASIEIIPFQRWRIGEWDGAPTGFQNADKVTSMHPLDVRMSSWSPVTYTIGSSSPSSFPAYQWKDVNNPTIIKFNLNANELTAHTLRVGLTCAYEGARPRISVNSWTSSIPSPSTQPNSRTLTVGTYRGNNVTYTYSIPASAFVAGTNTLTLTVVSGSGTSGFLSAGYSYDCVELDAPYNGTFRLTPQNAQDKSLSVQVANPANSTPLVVASYKPVTSQQFALDVQSDGTYRIRTLLAGSRCVELPFGDASNGTPVKLWDDNGNAAQRWSILPVVGDWVKIAPKNDSTKSLTVVAGTSATAENTATESRDFSGASNQLWKLTSATPDTPPTARNDSYSLDEDTTLTIPASTGVLANDFDADNDPFAIIDADATIVGTQPLSAPSHGTLTLNTDGSFAYTPTSNYNGPDSFSYTISDGSLTSEIATVSLAVNPINDAPVAASQNLSTPQDTPLDLTLTASDVEADTLTYRVVQFPQHGTLSGNAPSLTYTPNTKYSGPDSFAFVANDGTTDSTTTTISISVTATNGAPTVSVVISPAIATTNTLLQAVPTGNDPDGDQLSYTYAWKKNGVVLTNQTEDKLDLSTVRLGDKGDHITAIVTASDGSLFASSESPPLTIANSAPLVQSIVLSPPSIRTDDPLTATVVGADADNDTLLYTYTWTLVRNGQTRVVQTTGNTASTTDTLITKGSIVVAGDKITLSVTATDGTAVSTSKTAGITVNNTPVTIARLTLNPSLPRTNSVLVANAQFVDADGGRSQNTYVWKRIHAGQTTTVFTETTTGSQSRLDLAKLGYGDKNDVVSVTVTATDGSSSATKSAALRIGNAAPTVSGLVLSPVSPTRFGKVTATFSMSDPDASDAVDTLTPLFTWKAGGKALSIEKGATVDLSKYAFLKPGDTVTCELRIADGMAVSATSKATVTLGADARTHSSPSTDNS